EGLSLTLASGREWLNVAEGTRLLTQLSSVLAQMAKAPVQPHHTLSLMLADERQRVLIDWNKTQAAYPQDATLVSLFEQQVAKRPNAIALIFEEKSLTYAELNARTNALAQGLREVYQTHMEEPLAPDTLIALYLDRSIEMVVSILAVLKAGGAYVPLSPEYPQSRIDFILEDTQAAILLCQAHYQERLGNWTNNNINSTHPLILYVDDQPNWLGSCDNPTPSGNPENLAYVLYTSGTTGQPKGVMVEHNLILNLYHVLVQDYSFSQQEKSCVFSDYVFDASVNELFVSLLSGSETHLLSNMVKRDVNQLSKYLLKNEITNCYLPPVLLEQLPRKHYPSLKTITYAGEPCLRDVAAYWSQEVRLYNYYGPTETNIVTGRKIVSDEIEQIGRPISNTQVYVLDRQLNPLPIGAVGELYIGGANLARGYLKRKDLTAERFIDNPFASTEDQKKGYTRLYKSGDLVRWVMDAQGVGQLEYRGRNDMQVKIRGYRIELGEIETILGAQRGVHQAVVIDRKQGDQTYLAGYVVMHAEEIFDRNAMHSALTAALPAYMVPASLMAIESVPLTINGKLDRKALPAPKWLDERRYVAPRTALEAQLCHLWAEVLSLEKIGVEDDFFRSGGNSITAVALIGAIQRELGRSVPLAWVFEQSTVKQYSQKFLSDQKASFLSNLTSSPRVKKDLIMIHPGLGFSHVYRPLANLLASRFNCWGIDHYNLFSDAPTDSLSELAGIYLDQLYTHHLINEPIRLLGWSLGGNIALEMAYHLEQKGYQDIRVYVLDAKFFVSADGSDNDISMEELEENLKSMGLKLDDRILNSMLLNQAIVSRPLSGQLINTHVTLFKPLKTDDSVGARGLFNTPDNNLSSLVKQDLTIIPLQNVTHDNILDESAEIFQAILSAER
ncbi:MAG: amino acid adenylation domain-containing protein, partial [Gammaproteobacteria bacterium]|nr:amino acid adenylation domain-containing protein [Gammaproteobacteria bacterium]